MHLDGSTCSESPPERISDFEPPGRVPWTSARAQTWCGVRAGSLRATEPRARGKTRGQDRKNADGIKKRHLYMYIAMYKCVFLAHRHFFLSRPRVVSRALGSLARREPVGTPASNGRPWPTSVARALAVQSRKSPRGGIRST